jgi:hypothetical protein
VPTKSVVWTAAAEAVAAATSVRCAKTAVTEVIRTATSNAKEKPVAPTAAAANAALASLGNFATPRGSVCPTDNANPIVSASTAVRTVAVAAAVSAPRDSCAVKAAYAAPPNAGEPPVETTAAAEAAVVAVPASNVKPDNASQARHASLNAAQSSAEMTAAAGLAASVPPAVHARTELVFPRTSQVVAVVVATQVVALQATRALTEAAPGCSVYCSLGFGRSAGAAATGQLPNVEVPAVRGCLPFDQVLSDVEDPAHGRWDGAYADSDVGYVGIDQRLTVAGARP